MPRDLTDHELLHELEAVEANLNRHTSMRKEWP
jgi:hypothetical protein